MKPDYRSGDELGKVLAAAKLKNVILNACESASFRSSTSISNLAEVLLRRGIRSVLAMLYKVVDEAVEIFTNSFYQSLLVKELSVQDAARTCRQALMQNRSRRARYMHRVQLADYIVPTFYTSSPERSPMALPVDQIAKKSFVFQLDDLLDSISKGFITERETKDPELKIERDLNWQRQRCPSPRTSPAAFPHAPPAWPRWLWKVRVTSLSLSMVDRLGLDQKLCLPETWSGVRHSRVDSQQHRRSAGNRS